jgi:hypothetical protein
MPTGSIDLDGVIAMAAETLQPGSNAQLELDIRIEIEESLARNTAPCLVIGGIEDRWGHLVIGELSAEIASTLSAQVA